MLKSKFKLIFSFIVIMILLSTLVFATDNVTLTTVQDTVSSPELTTTNEISTRGR